MQRNVPSVKTCKQLKDAGYPQMGKGFYWIKRPEREFVLALKVSELYRHSDSTKFELFIDLESGSQHIIHKDKGVEVYRAPTVQELLDELPHHIKVGDYDFYLKCIKSGENRYYCEYNELFYSDELEGFTPYLQNGENVAELLAHLYIELNKEK